MKDSNKENKTTKNTNKKTETKNIKTTKKSTKEKVEKKVSKKREKKSLKEFFTSEKFLLIVFILLLLLVIVLGCLVAFRKTEEKEIIKANIVFPIIKTKETFEFSVNAKKLANEGQYIFKLINYKDGNVVKEEIPYKIIIENNIGAELKLTKDENKNNLMDKETQTTIEETSLGTEEENQAFYYLTIDNNKEYNENDLIQIKIES